MSAETMNRIAKAAERVERLEPGAHWTGLVDVESVKTGLDYHFGASAGWSVRPVVGDSTGRGHNATPVAVGWRRLFPRRWMQLD